MNKVNLSIYDFDKIVYNGETAIDFWLFMLQEKPLLILYLPYQLYYGILFMLNIIGIKELKEEFFVFMTSIGELNSYIERFWQENREKINQWFYNTVEEDREKLDLVGCISASPDFLLEYILEELGFDFFLATEFCRTDSNQVKSKIRGENCKNNIKVKKLKKWCRNNNYQFEIEKFYSDSITDLPLYKLARQKYVVKNGELYRGKPKK